MQQFTPGMLLQCNINSSYCNAAYIANLAAAVIGCGGPLYIFYTSKARTDLLALGDQK
jgi:hypothetical protein